MRKSDRFDELGNHGLSGYFTRILSNPGNVRDYVLEEFKAKCGYQDSAEFDNESSQELAKTIEKYGISSPNL